MAGLIKLINQYMLTEFVPFMCKEHNLEEEDVAATWMRFVKNEQPESQVVNDTTPQVKASKVNDTTPKVKASKVNDTTPKVKASKVNDPKKVVNEDGIPNDKMTIATLKNICRARSLKVTGTKKQLLIRIQDDIDAKAKVAKIPEEDADAKAKVAKIPEEDADAKAKVADAKAKVADAKAKVADAKAKVAEDDIYNTETDDESDNDEEPSKKAPPKSVKKSKNDKPNVIKMMEKKKEEIILTTDIYGNIVHEETGIAFSHDEEELNGVKCRYAIGYRLESGSLEELNTEKMKICDQYSFRYRIPENFDED
jgi:hypothetical protein